MPMPSPAVLVAPPTLADGRPADFSPQDWTALKQAMAKTANPRAELDRVVRYLRFQKGFAQWQALREASGDEALRHKLASRLLEQVPERLKQGEMTYGEAMVLNSALLEDLEPDDAQRKQRLEQAQAALNASTNRQEDVEQAMRDAAMLSEYKRREAAIVAAFQTLPEEQRDQAQLSRDLDAARLAVYGSKK
jgi:hypothetical protein